MESPVYLYSVRWVVHHERSNDKKCFVACDPWVSMKKNTYKALRSDLRIYCEPVVGFQFLDDPVDDTIEQFYYVNSPIFYLPGVEMT